MILPRGITGFGKVPDSPTAPPDFKAFKSACYEAARRLGGVVVRAESCHGRVTPNFHRASLTLPEEAVDVICNDRFPLVTIIRPLLTNESLLLRFVDVPRLAEVMNDTGLFHVLASAELDAPLNPEVLSELESVELKQIAYWKPRRIGDVIFNFWD